MLENAGLHVRRLIVWHESFGQAGNKNFGRTCRFIWYAVKDPNYVFNEHAALTESKRATSTPTSARCPAAR
jgi:phage terminase large subunit-like protein